jgi:hypothetical protein
MAVVVLDVDTQDAKKLPTPCDQEMVQALPAHAADPALGDSVGSRRQLRLIPSVSSKRFG